MIALSSSAISSFNLTWYKLAKFDLYDEKDNIISEHVFSMGISGSQNSIKVCTAFFHVNKSKGCVLRSRESCWVMDIQENAPCLVTEYCNQLHPESNYVLFLRLNEKTGHLEMRVQSDEKGEKNMFLPQKMYEFTESNAWKPRRIDALSNLIAVTNLPDDWEAI